MGWIDTFQLFLFDFDGLLVDTEHIHFHAYKAMCRDHDVDFDWSFEKYCTYAHYSSEGFQKALYEEYPRLAATNLPWSELYQQKKDAYIRLLMHNKVQMMPGAAALLQYLADNDKARCVVTHSASDLIRKIRQDNPILDTIPHWMTRETYTFPKPHPECYIKAIELFAKPGDRVVGFEDTPRGIHALMGSSAHPVIVSTIHYPEIPSFIEKGITHLPTLREVFLV